MITWEGSSFGVNLELSSGKAKDNASKRDLDNIHMKFEDKLFRKK